MAARESTEIWGRADVRGAASKTGCCVAGDPWSWDCGGPPRVGPQPKVLVVRVDEVGRAEAVAYEAMEAQADPLDPTTGFVVDHYLLAAAGHGSASTGSGFSGF